jgi:hypothetical protein
MKAITLFILSSQAGEHWEDEDVSGWTILKWILER